MVQSKKHDRNALFLEYLTSDEESVYGFCKKRGIISGAKKAVDWANARATAGRSKKKEEFKKRAMDMAIAKLEKETAEKVYAPSIKELSNMHQKIMQVAALALNDMAIIDPSTNKPKLNPKQNKLISLKEVREITKVEKKEPTKYIEDLSEPKEVLLSPEQIALANAFKSVLKAKFKPKK